MNTVLDPGVLEALRAAASEFVDIRRDIHRHPELGFKEHRTSALVAARLKAWGYEVDVGLGGTGVVGTLKRGTGSKTIGIRVPDHPVAQGLLDVLGQPLICTTLLLPGDELPRTDAGEIRERLEHEVDLVIDSGDAGIEPTTIVDLTGREAVLVRRGRGPIEALGLSA